MINSDDTDKQREYYRDWKDGRVKRKPKDLEDLKDPPLNENYDDCSKETAEYEEDDPSDRPPLNTYPQHLWYPFYLDWW